MILYQYCVSKYLGQNIRSKEESNYKRYRVWIKYMRQVKEYLDLFGVKGLSAFLYIRKEQRFQTMVMILFAHYKKINIFYFMHKGVAQKLSLPCPLEI